MHILGVIPVLPAMIRSLKYPLPIAVSAQGCKGVRLPVPAVQRGGGKQQRVLPRPVIEGIRVVGMNVQKLSISRKMIV